MESLVGVRAERRSAVFGSEGHHASLLKMT
jgi:hypothetical protein